MSMKRLILLMAALLLLAAACATTQPPATTFPTASAAISPTPSPSATPTGTPVPPTLIATPQYIEGTLTIKVNVRSGPGTNFAALGQLNAGEKVQVILRDGTGEWYQILYPSASGGRGWVPAPGGFGWVAAQFVQIAAGTVVPPQAALTPAGPSGRVLQLLNVRSGPGMTFASLGMLQPDVVVVLKGKNSTASWLQIVYPAGPGGHGWVTAQYIQTDASGLPVLDENGAPATSGAPAASGTAGSTPIPVTSTPTAGPAAADDDSPANPGVNVPFSATGTHQFTYSSQVSAPEGDPEDWIEFSPYAVNAAEARLVFSLTCTGNGTLTVEIRQGGSLLSGRGTLSCGILGELITLPAGQTYEIRLAPAPGEGLRLVDYILTVQNEP